MIKRTLLGLLLIAGLVSVSLTACSGSAAQTEQGNTAVNQAGKNGSQYQDWNPAYTGAFAWYNGSQTQYGWHWAHDANAKCRVDMHPANCGCDWCKSQYAPTLTADGPQWVAYTDDGTSRWCSAYPHSDWNLASGTATAGTYQRWHNRDCGCGWCQGTRLSPTNQTGSNPDNGVVDYSWHGSNCGCGHCGHHSGYDNCYNRSRSSSSSRRHGCGCGCC